MNEIIIGYDKEPPQDKGGKIKISVLNKHEKELLFKFIVGLDGSWETLRNFSKEKNVVWKPKEEGNYIIMVQAKSKESNKSFEYISKCEYKIGHGNEENPLIKEISLNKNKFNVGEKVYLKVESKIEPIIYRYFIKKDEKWILVKDYSRENTFACSAKIPGINEILVQCKSLDSKENFQDVKKIEYKVLSINKLEINNFKCLNSELLVDEELVFEVNVKCEDTRMVLYKFIKINLDGKSKCIQDYSTKKMVSFKEKNKGKYRLLCLIKDMYSPYEYDDRGIIFYEVKPYKKVEILNFISDLSSPQIEGKNILLKAVAQGGKNLRYRYLIEGTKNEDSTYIKDPEYLWKPEKPGTYKIKLYVKDNLYEGKYEDARSIDFVIDEISREPVKIDDIVLDKKKTILIKENINIKVIAQGGMKLLYSFIVAKDGVEEEKINYGSCNYIDFTPKNPGRFQIEIRVKDKYSEKLFDAHEIIQIDAYKYIPSKIDYILTEAKSNYLIGEQIVLDVITQETEDTLLKYVLEINNHKVEETSYSKSKRYFLHPRCSGKYSIKVYAKNKKSDKEFDSTKQVVIMVNEAPPVTNTKIKCDRFKFYPSEPIEVTAESIGGKDVVYEFYLMENNEWNLVQKYSKKNYYNFIPFTKGIYKVLALAKSNYKRVSYEDYCMIKFKVRGKLEQGEVVKNKDIVSSEEILNNKSLRGVKFIKE